jgi:hypothetical protein
MSEKRHFFVCGGREYLVIGYNPEKHNVACVCFDVLHRYDQHDLEFLTNSEDAQAEPYLAAILARHPYAGGGTWWERLMPHIFFAEVGQIEGRIPDEQYQIFMKAFSDYESQKWPSVSCEYEERKAEEPNAEEQTSVVETAEKENIDDIIFGHIGRDLED